MLPRRASRRDETVPSLSITLLFTLVTAYMLQAPASAIPLILVAKIVPHRIRGFF